MYLVSISTWEPGQRNGKQRLLEEVRTGVYRATWEGPGEVRVLNQCQVID